jgi:Cd2+/Zn2+-exporting ATPase
MGAMGSDAAVEKSDVVIMDDDVAKVPLAIKIAKSARKIVVENIIFSIVAKASIMALCAIGILPLFGAVLGDVGILILCILNAIRAGR